MDKELRAEVLKKLGLTDADEQLQDVSLYNVETMANKRIALVMPELLSDEQFEKVDEMKSRGESDEAIIEWVTKQIPEYDNMVKSMILDVVDEILAHGVPEA